LQVAHHVQVVGAGIAVLKVVDPVKFAGANRLSLVFTAAEFVPEPT
jgi:hypothetical protein